MFLIFLASLLFSCQAVSNSLQSYGLPHARPPCPSSSPGVCPNSYSLNWWCHPTMSSSVIPFSSWLPSFLASGSFPVSWLFVSGSESIGASPLASVLPVNIQGWFLLGLTGLISLLSKRLSRVFPSTTITKVSILQCSDFMVQLLYLYIITGKIVALTIWISFWQSNVSACTSRWSQVK